MGIATALLDLNTVQKFNGVKKSSNNNFSNTENDIIQENVHDSNYVGRHAFHPIQLPKEIHEAINLNKINEINDEIDQDGDNSILISISNYNTPYSSPNSFKTSIVQGNKSPEIWRSSMSLKPTKALKVSKLKRSQKGNNITGDYTPNWRKSSDTTGSASSKRLEGKRKIKSPSLLKDYHLISQGSSKSNKNIITKPKIKLYGENNHYNHHDSSSNSSNSSRSSSSSNSNKWIRIDENDSTNIAVEYDRICTMSGVPMTDMSDNSTTTTIATPLASPTASPIVWNRQQLMQRIHNHKSYSNTKNRTDPGSLIITVNHGQENNV